MVSSLVHGVRVVRVPCRMTRRRIVRQQANAFWPNPEHDDNISATASRNSSSWSASGNEWRQRQLQELEQKFLEPSQVVENDEDLQQPWKEMESRVTRRRPRTLQEMGGKTGRTNIKSTDEEIWLHEGMYKDDANSDGDADNDDGCSGNTKA